MRLRISLIPSISFPFPLLPTPNLLFSKAFPFWTYHETQQHILWAFVIGFLNSVSRSLRVSAAALIVLLLLFMKAVIFHDMDVPPSPCPLIS